MRTLLVACLLLGCGPSRPAPVLKKPNDELILGDFTRRGPDGTAAIRFTGDHAYRVVKDKTMFDREPPVGTGTWKLEGDRLVLTAQKGMCTDGRAEREATYQVVISKIGIRFTKVGDDCSRRATMDGQTWWRIQ
ncbi:MAG TPA: hypothetical protein VN253_27270 [Kofleriaceae bacterium]|nr:hypothetical protein [Kofleriaceae bacterium]